MTQMYGEGYVSPSPEFSETEEESNIKPIQMFKLVLRAQEAITSDDNTQELQLADCNDTKSVKAILVEKP